LAKECQATVERAWAADPGNFTELEHLRVDDTRGLLGRSEARNRAVLRALETGADWIFFLDADDGLLPGAFRSVSPFLGHYEAVWGSIIEMSPGQTAFDVRVPQVLTLGSFTEVLLHDPYHTLQMGHFVRASVAAQHPFHTGMNTGEDFDYYLRLWENHHCAKVQEAFFVNRRGAHSSGPRSADGSQWRAAVEGLLTEARAKAGVSAESPAGRVVVNAKTLEYRGWIGSQAIAPQNVPYEALSAVFPFHGEWTVDCYESAPFTLVSENDDPAVKSIFWTGTFEPEVMDVWLRLAREAAEIVDVGSFGGLYGLAAAAQPRRTRVSFVHSLLANRLRVQRNLESNTFEHAPVMVSSLSLLEVGRGFSNRAGLLVGLDMQGAGKAGLPEMEAILAVAAPDVLIHGLSTEGWESWQELFSLYNFRFYQICRGRRGLEMSHRFAIDPGAQTRDFLVTYKSPDEVRKILGMNEEEL